VSWNQQFFLIRSYCRAGNRWSRSATRRNTSLNCEGTRPCGARWALSKEENHDDQTYDVGCYRPVVIRCARIGCTACCFQPRLLRAVLPQCQLPKLRAGQPLSKLWLGSGALAPSSSPALALNSTEPLQDLDRIVPSRRRIARPAIGPTADMAGMLRHLLGDTDRVLGISAFDCAICHDHRVVAPHDWRCCKECDPSAHL
jgi:hypothetical protein